ncbi:head-tail connector protein [Flavobacterium sp.]|uniref:head-tail connector protein n=1 Tax=Flavobacterium sp. TaxID=239 RepID=UPI002612C913|nr:head-tail connector protein [Flavobacterium sp.]
MVTDVSIIPFPDEISLITLVKAKKQLRIEASITEEDEIIQVYIDAAQSAAENYIGRAIGRRKLILKMNSFDLKEIEASSNEKIESVVYFPAGETESVIMDADQYKLKSSNVINCFEIGFLSTPEVADRPDAITITIVQGYALAECPKAIIQAMNLLISDYYERREDREQGNNPASNNLLRPYRRYN